MIDQLFPFFASDWDGASLGLLLLKLTLVLALVLVLRIACAKTSAAFRHGLLGLALVAIPLVVVFHFLSPAFRLSWQLPDAGLFSLAAEPARNGLIDETGLPSSGMDRLTNPILAARESTIRTNWFDPANVSPTYGTDSNALNRTEDDSSGIEIQNDENRIATCEPFTADIGQQESVQPESRIVTKFSPRNPFVNRNAEAQSSDARPVSSETGCCSTPFIESVLVVESVSADRGSAGSAFGFPFVSSLISLWLIVVLCFISRLIRAWIYVSRLVNRARPIEVDEISSPAVRKTVEQIRSERIRIRVSSNAAQMPLGIGLFRRTILLPASCHDWCDEQWQSVLLHERAHFERGDCWTNLFARLQHALLWFHPLALMLVRRLRHESELACDDRVLESGVSRSQYAGFLLQFARNSTTARSVAIATVTMSDSRELESRMKSILSGTTTRRPITVRAMLLMGGLLCLSALPVATAQLTGADSNAARSLQENERNDENNDDTGFETRDRKQNLTSDQEIGETNVEKSGDTETSEDNNTTVNRDDANLQEDSAANASAIYLFDLLDGATMRRAEPFELEMETEFGRTFVESRNLFSLSRLDPKNDEFKLRSHRGSELIGNITTGELELTPLDSDGTNSEPVVVKFSKISGVRTLIAARLRAGMITDGQSDSGLSYHLRAPDGFDATQSYPAIAIFHGSNSNSKSYLRKIETVWPEIAARYILIGINGEQRPQNFDPDDPRYNFTYVNFVGENCHEYNGFPGTDRESPTLVAETIAELRRTLPINKLFVGGHSQGGFLTYSVLMNFPELVDGAFPMAGGLLIQCEPTAFEQDDFRAMQRQVPVVILHARNDRSVDHSMSVAAHASFLDDRWPMLRLLDESGDGHSFSNLPLAEAIDWLEQMTPDTAEQTVDAAFSLAVDGRKRDALALLNRYDSLEDESDENKAVAAKIRTLIDDAVRQNADAFEALIRENKDASWLEEFLSFRSEYEFANSAAGAMEAFAELRDKHDELAEDLFDRASEDRRKNRTDDAVTKYSTIVQRLYASRKYKWARIRLEELQPDWRERFRDGRAW